MVSTFCQRQQISKSTIHFEPVSPTFFKNKVNECSLLTSGKDVKLITNKLNVCCDVEAMAAKKNEKVGGIARYVCSKQKVHLLGYIN